MWKTVLVAAIASCSTPAHDPATPSDVDAAIITPPTVDAAPSGDAPAADDPTAGVVWFTWPAQQTKADATWGGVLTDIANHLPASYGDTYWDADAMTAGHETSHGIHAHLRNNETPASIGWNAFYVLGDRAAFVAEPAMRKSAVNAYVPTSLRGSRYDTYLVGQTAWDDSPLYLFDEWSAYANGAAVAIDQVQHGLYTGQWTDAVMGPLEFSAYAIATAKAISVVDPTYFASNVQFKRFTAWQIQRAMKLYGLGSVMTQFTWDVQDAYLAALRTSADAADLRAFARATWGAAWTQTVLGF